MIISQNRQLFFPRQKSYYFDDIPNQKQRKFVFLQTKFIVKPV
jgi:hypothetical protein